MSFEEKLIEMVREREVLYDLKHPNYRRVDIKEKIWQKIAEELQSSADVCKKRWRSLRDKFIKLNRQIMSRPSGSAAGEPSTRWKYFDTLRFLKGVQDKNESVSNFVDVDEYYIDFDENPDENIDLNNIECRVEDNQTPNKKRKRVELDLQQQFKDLLDNANEAINAATMPLTALSETTNMQFFKTLAAKVDDAKLSAERVNRLQAAVAKLVFDSI